MQRIEQIAGATAIRDGTRVFWKESGHDVYLTQVHKTIGEAKRHVRSILKSKGGYSVVLSSGEGVPSAGNQTAS